MRSILLTALLTTLSTATSTEAGLVPAPDVVSIVRRLQPALTLREAARVASAVVEAGKTCVVPWDVLIAIGFVESGLRVGSTNSKTGDYGLFQINRHTARSMHLQLSRLLTDETYGAEAACQILKTHRRAYGGKVNYWLGTYQAGTHLRDPRIRLLAQSYDRKVRKLAKDLYASGGVRSQ